MSSGDHNVLETYLQLVSEAPKLGMEVLNRLYYRFWAYFIVYLIVMFSIAHLAWWANISGNKSFIYPIILVQIPLSLLLLMAPQIVKPYILGRLVYGIVFKEKFGLELVGKFVDQFLNIISSITYFFVWMLLILTVLNFQGTPYSSYFVLYLLALAMIMLEFIGDGKKRFTNLVAVSSPKKLMVQFLITMIKIAIPFELNELF
ncbi:MAG: hypothetical protein ABJN35_00060 [Erythrobacter sp.]